jgi:hypothetical protein
VLHDKARSDGREVFYRRKISASWNIEIRARLNIFDKLTAKPTRRPANMMMNSVNA